MRFLSQDRFKKLPDAIFFDLDNTLYNYNPAHQSALNAVKNKMIQKFALSGEDFDKLLAKAKEYTKERLEGTASSHSRLLYFQKMLELMGTGSQLLYTLDFEQTYWRTFLAKAKLFEGVFELLEEIRLLEIPIAIVTDMIAQVQFRKILYFNLDYYFDCVVTSEEVGCEKPCEAIFKSTLKKLNMQEGATVWMIGDHPDKDISGARNAIGAITLQKVHDGVVLGQADAFFNHYSQIIKFITTLSAKI